MHSSLFSTFSHYDTVILVGGGTGGHIQPIVNIAQELNNIKNLLWIGGKNSQEEIVAKKENIRFAHIITLKLETTHSPRVLLYPLILLKGIFEARKILKKELGMTNYELRTCMFSKGGPGSVAIGIAAWTLGIDLFIHESDTIPGRSNRILGKIATKIFLGFEHTKKYFKSEKCETIGQILGRVFEGKMTNKKGTVNWKTEKKHILVICGSQGAKTIFEAIIQQFEQDNPYEWIISLGTLNNQMKSHFEKIKDIQALEWIHQEDIAHLLQNTNIAITRGSATTLAEINVFGVKKIIIPLPYSCNNHQYWNAKEYEKNGDILLEQKNITSLKEYIHTSL